MRLQFTASIVLVASLFGTAGAHSVRSRELQETSSQEHGASRGTIPLAKLAKNCDECQTLIGAVKSLIKEDENFLINQAKESCVDNSKYDIDFCIGAVEREGPIVASVLKTMDAESPASLRFCSSLFRVCESPPVDEWAVSLPPLNDCSGERKSISGKKPLQIVHYSDVHLDPLYSEGASTQCQRPSCCRTSDKVSKEKPLHGAGRFGDHNCDTPMTLERSMHEFIKKKFPSAAFAMFTGDIVDHGVHNTSINYNRDLIEQAYHRMHDYMDIVYGTAGNHEAHPVNAFAPQTVGNDTQWLYDSLFKQWSHELNTSSSTDHKFMGAYSTKYPHGNLRIISLNTNMYYRFNFLLYQKVMERDPDGQLAWLVNELNAAEKAGENVYIIGHMPMGNEDALLNGSNYFSQIVQRYSKTIKAMFFGHTHADHFQISYSNYVNRMQSNAFAVSYICPSLTPTSGHPAFRLYDVDPETFAVLDATTYIADMDDPSFQQSGPTWKKYYSAKEAYGHAVSPPMTDPAAELSPSFWHNVTEAMEKNQTLFNQYMARKSRGWHADENCKDACKKNEICALRTGRSEDLCRKPMRNNTLTQQEKRGESETDTHHHGHHDACGVPVSADLLRGLFESKETFDMMVDVL
ncbi:hypothetical protein E4U39_003595 [Claviceps sp. Clav50 group G5]|nr:hypothetical protein E4U39_003595 [Claviceps sp. Clav50 group G5]